MSREYGGLRSAAVFSLCGLFAALAIGLVLLASGVYRTAAAQEIKNDARRTALSYLMNQVRRADNAGGIVVTTFPDDALSLSEEVDGTNYVTLIYCYEGQLRELYAEAGTDVRPEDGIPILELQSLQISAEDGRITFTVTDQEGTISSGTLSPRCGFQEVKGL